MGSAEYDEGRLQGSDPHHQLAAILPGEHSGKRGGHVFESLDDIDRGLDLALFDPGRECRLGLAPTLIKVHDDETLHPDALRHEESRHACRTGRWSCRVIVRD